MSWITLTTTDLQRRLSAEEIKALQSLALVEGQSDPLPECLADAANMVRGYIAAAGSTLGVSPTIPEGLKSTALAVALYEACTRLPQKLMLNEQREKLYSDAITRLQAVADGKFKVEAPSTASSESIGNVGPSSGSPDPATHPFSRANQEGI